MTKASRTVLKHVPPRCSSKQINRLQGHVTFREGHDEDPRPSSTVSHLFSKKGEWCDWIGSQELQFQTTTSQQDHLRLIYLAFWNLKFLFFKMIGLQIPQLEIHSVVLKGLLLLKYIFIYECCQKP